MPTRLRRSPLASCDSLLRGLFLLAACALAVGCRSDPERSAVAATSAPALSAVPLPVAPADVRVAPRDAVRTPSGLASRVLVSGTGAPAAGRDQLVLAYDGWAADGAPFASTYARRERIGIDRDLLFPGLRELVDGMREGEKRRAWIPAALAEGGKPSHPFGDLVMDVELVQVRVHHVAPPSP